MNFSSRIPEPVLTVRASIPTYLVPTTDFTDPENSLVYDEIVEHSIFKNLIRTETPFKFQSDIDMEAQELIVTIIAYLAPDEHDEYCKNKMMNRLKGVHDKTNIKL